MCIHVVAQCINASYRLIILIMIPYIYKLSKKITRYRIITQGTSMALSLFMYPASLFQNIFFILIGCFGMGFLIGFHELGHFLFAKLFNIRTPSFSIGFGPKILSKKIGKTEFSLSAIPFGGYVEIAGAAEIGQGEQKEALAMDNESFAVKPFYQKLFVMLGGILFNLLFAYCAFITLFWTGIPKTPLMQKPIIAAIQENSPAQQYDLQIGDKIVAIRNESIENSIQKLQTLLFPLASQEVSIIIERNGVSLEKSIVLGEKEVNGKKIGILGIEFEISETPPQSFFEAVKQGINATNLWIKNTITGFLHIKKGAGDIAGPVMIVAMTTKAASSGAKIFLLLLSIISINLAVLNLIPLPILDGGQILFYSIEALIGRPLPVKVREYIHITTWIMFIILFLYLSTKDIWRLVGPYIAPLLNKFGL